MAKTPLPQDGAGVPYLADADSSGNLAVPEQDFIALPNNQYLAEAASLRQQQVLTTTPLGANATYTLSPAIDSLAVPQDNMVCAHVYADQPGTLYMDVSMDNSNWNLTQASIAVSAGVATTLPWQAPLDRYYRFRYINGANAQGVFRLSTSAMSVAGPQNVNASITGSLANQPFDQTKLVNGVFTFTSPQNGFTIINNGTSNLTFTINGGTYTLQPSQGFQEKFPPFTSVSIASTGTLLFNAYGLL